MEENSEIVKKKPTDLGKLKDYQTNQSFNPENELVELEFIGTKYRVIIKRQHKVDFTEIPDVECTTCCDRTKIIIRAWSPMDCALSLLERLVMLMETQDKKVEFGKHIVNYTVANNWMFRGFESSEAQRTAKKIEEKEFYNNHILKTNKMLEVKVKLLTTDGKVPTQSKAGDAGFDLVATSKSWDKEGNFMEYGTGIAVEIPVGHAGLIFPRSSVSKTDLIQANCVGVVDAGYRGEVKVRFKVVRHVNLSRIEDASLHGAPEVKDFQIGDRIAQLVIMPIPEVAYTVVAELSNSDRGEGGFGHTGQ